LGKFVHCNEQKVWKIGHRNEQNNGNLFVTTERDAQIYGKIWWILPKVGKKYGGIVPKNI